MVADFNRNLSYNMGWVRCRLDLRSPGPEGSCQGTTPAALLTARVGLAPLDPDKARCSRPDPLTCRGRRRLPPQAGASLSRRNLRTHSPPRPKAGWSLVVRPLGAAKAAKRLGRAPEVQEPYVAQPDGSRRPLTEDERFLVDRQTPRPRRKVL